ncbi:cysteine-rich receptor-like protein kinase 25-like protein, partial [Trifolium pratense]
MVKGLPTLAELDENCVDCLTGKQHRDAIPKQATWRVGMKMELVHSDICGPIKPTSNGGNSNQSIKRQLTTTYTSQQNGVSERKNRTLMNMVRSMLAGRKMPKAFWPKALKWATYVMNRSPTLSVKNITPEEAWSGSKPYVHHFRVFGCIAYAHVPENQRSKLDNRSTKCVHLGLSEESKAYKLYNHENKIIISRDVVFEENKCWNWDKNGKNGKVRNNQNIDEDDHSDEEINTPTAINTKEEIVDEIDNAAAAPEGNQQSDEEMHTSSDDNDVVQ